MGGIELVYGRVDRVARFALDHNVAGRFTTQTVTERLVDRHVGIAGRYREVYACAGSDATNNVFGHALYYSTGHAAVGYEHFRAKMCRFVTPHLTKRNSYLHLRVSIQNGIGPI